MSFISIIVRQYIEKPQKVSRMKLENSENEYRYIEYIVRRPYSRHLLWCQQTCRAGFIRYSECRCRPSFKHSRAFPAKCLFVYQGFKINRF